MQDTTRREADELAEQEAIEAAREATVRRFESDNAAVTVTVRRDVPFDVAADQLRDIMYELHRHQVRVMPSSDYSHTPKNQPSQRMTATSSAKTASAPVSTAYAATCGQRTRRSGRMP